VKDETRQKLKSISTPGTAANISAYPVYLPFGVPHELLNKVQSLVEHAFLVLRKDFCKISLIKRAAVALSLSSCMSGPDPYQQIMIISIPSAWIS